MNSKQKETEVRRKGMNSRQKGKEAYPRIVYPCDILPDDNHLSELDHSEELREINEISSNTRTDRE